MKNKLEHRLPILQSSLPPFERMIPYLAHIENNRCHSNFGKLFNLFEQRMADLLQIPRDNLVMVCNGTLALQTGLMAMGIDKDKYCLMPSWTFSATPASAMLAGLRPLFLDVDLDTQALTPALVKQFLAHDHVPIEEIGAVMVVSPFGYPIPRAEWDAFTAETKIPVMIDAAASFDAVHRLPQMRPGATPMMVSLHGTKIFGIGEGGMLLSSDVDLISRVKGMSNFGFDVSRTSSYLGTNAKMSEYQAGIGLAVLDAWDEIREKRLAVTSNYITMFDQLGLKSWLSIDWLSSTCNVLVSGLAELARDYMLDQNIESRIWWNKGCHTYPAYQGLPKELRLLNTEYLSQAMLGLPFSIDTNQDVIAMIGDRLADFLAVNANKQFTAKEKATYC